LSGIGSRAILEQYNIEVLIENPSVGENLQDHALVGLCYEVADRNASLDALRDPELLSEAICAYATNKTGPFAAGVEASAFVPLTLSFSGGDEVDFSEALSDDWKHENVSPAIVSSTI
jgi:choline dehydrogenase-like flavoprotein